MTEKNFCIGVDFGTDSVRAILVDAADGAELASSVFQYPRWRDGLYCDASANQFRQHPLDYLEGLQATVRGCIEQAGDGIRPFIRSLSLDTTGSSPVAVDEKGIPLSLHARFADDPDAMFVLWKDHSAAREAAEINNHAASTQAPYLRYVGGIYSSEWFWSKLLHVLRVNQAVRNACYSWVEHCDWLPFLLTGGSHVRDMKRGVCTAGHKALWSPEWGGLPPNSFFATLDPLLDGFTAKLYTETYTADKAAGKLTAEWAEKLNLLPGVVVGIGAMDAHMGAVGGQIEPYHLSKVMGTSTCDMLVAPTAEVSGTVVRGICGQVEGSIIPGMMGLEAGQSAFGDVYSWFTRLLSWPLKNLLFNNSIIDHSVAGKLLDHISAGMIAELDRAAAQVGGRQAESAVDWFNGRRTPDANADVKAMIGGLSLGSDAPRIYRALVESTCFGAKAIIERFRSEGVPIRGLIGVGGIARKSPFVMQMMADVLDMPIRIHRSEQTCAHGATMFAATAAGIYPRVEDAMQAMGRGFDREYQPDRSLREQLQTAYQRYQSQGRFIESVQD